MVAENQRHMHAHVLAYDVVRCQQFNIIFAWCVLSFGVCLFVMLKKDNPSACGCCCNVLTPISLLCCCLRMRNNSEMEMWIPKPASLVRSELWNYSITSAAPLHRNLWLFIGTKCMYFHHIAREQIGRPPACVVVRCPLYDPKNLCFCTIEVLFIWYSLLTKFWIVLFILIFG